MGTNRTLPGARHLALAGALAMIGLGCPGFATAEMSVDGRDTSTLRNPIPAVAESIAAGRAVFEKNCQVCHGADGKGVEMGPTEACRSCGS